jgi:hypothetical protein
MNDLELLRDWRAEVGGPDASQLAAGRERLTALIAAGRPPRRIRSESLLRPGALGFAGATMLAAAVALIVVLGGTRPGTSRVSLAAQILQRAAVVRGEQPGSRPSPHQWIYQYFVSRELGQTQRNGAWERFDGRRTASYVNGRLVVFREKRVRSPEGNPLRAYLADPTPWASYAALASLPASPRRLLAAVDEVIRHDHSFDPNGLPALTVVPTHTAAQREFEFITQLLWQDTQSGIVRGGGAVFRALAMLPGVQAQRGITDALGRPAVGISDDGGAFQLLLSPRTYQVLGFRSVSTGSAPHLPNGGTTPRGTVVESVASRAKLVPAPGDR